MQRWYPDYQTRDQDIVDYHEFRLKGCDVPFRGPAFDPFTAKPGSFFTCIGAAQTYGCYYDKPFPNLLAEAIGMPCLNLAVGGTGPGFYLQYPSLIEAMNRGRFVILQAMSARHEGNSRFAPDGYVEFVKERSTGESVTSSIAWRRIMDEEPENALRYVDEVRQSWVETTRKLKEKITVPVLFFWYARRGQDYAIDMDAALAQTQRRRGGADEGHFVDALAGDFPQYVDSSAARRAAALCDATAECVSSRGMGQPLINRHTGKPIGDISFEALGPEFTSLHQTHNVYYPSAEMHEDAVQALLPVVRKLLAK